MEIRTYLETQRNRVDQFIEGYFEASDVPERLRKSMTYSLFAGGKRIRPVLAIAAFEASGGSGDSILAVAGALELIHTYSLVHDDLPAMDDDDLRRGRPTNHKVFGEAGAILAGDALLSEAFEMLAEERVFPAPPEIRIRVVREIARGAGARGMVAGQLADIEAEGTPPDGETLREIHRRKTGALITASVLAGGIAAGADTRVLNRLREYAEAVGLAFQVTDDILDVTATEQELGKSTSDEARGKVTYPSLYGLERSREMAANLVNGAIRALEGFGEEADPLRGIGRLILSRTS